MTPHAVISGAGVAGPALAWHLQRNGWRTTVIERFAARREEGQNVDIRDAAREVVRRMGLSAGPVGRAVGAVAGDRFAGIAGGELRLPQYPSGQPSVR